MNRQITQLFGVVLVLFTLLIVFTSRWTVFEAKSLQNQTANRRPLLEELQIPRGFILAADGTKLAVNKRSGHGPTLRYSRVYPTDNLFSHTVGYSFIYWNHVVLAGNQIDTNLTTPLPSAAAPPFPKFQRTDFWVQGINLGGEFRW